MKVAAGSMPKAMGRQSEANRPEVQVAERGPVHLDISVVAASVSLKNGSGSVGWSSEALEAPLRGAFGIETSQEYPQKGVGCEQSTGI